jgi:hypothetical protein
MPDNTVKVDRSTKWGNPFTADAALEAGYGQPHRIAVVAFRAWLSGDFSYCGADQYRDRRAAILAGLPELRGKNLACWCRPDRPCHADVLLELANA